MFTDKTQFASAFTALVTPDNELIVIESPRITRELELPGGGVDEADSNVRAAADRENLEEAGIDTTGLFAYGQAELSSRINPNKTGLIVVTLAQQDVDEIDFTYSSSESTRVLAIPIEQFVELPTRDEDPNAPMLTFRAHRVMATVAMGIINGDLPVEAEDFLSAPFANELVAEHQAHYYQVPSGL